MFLRKIAASEYYKKTRVWVVWLAFSLLIFSLTRLMMSLDLIRMWKPSKFDIFMELGFYYFLSFIEVLIASIVLGGIQIGIERLIRKNLDWLAQVILVCVVMIPFVNLVLVIFKLPSL
jgi:hypothetical protein